MQIREFEALLGPELGDKKIVEYSTKYLMEPGENYGSVLLSVHVKVKNDEDKEEEDLFLVAKMCPPTEYIKKIFNTPVTFRKEAGMYSVIVPTMQDFQRERGADRIINCFPKYYASRYSLDSELDEVDDDACLLLENVTAEGYVNRSRLDGFDLETVELIIKDLAMFHAVPLALRICDPDRFNDKITPYLMTHVEEGDENFGDLTDGFSRAVLESAAKNYECAQHLQKLKDRLEVNTYNFKHPSNLDPGPFATITHCDYWVNNTMIKYDDEGRPISNLMVDFQLMIYGNPMRDLIFLIYSSLNPDIISNNYQHLIDLYHTTFTGVLEELEIDTEPFGYDTFLQEIDRAAKDVEVFHILFMYKPILTDKEKVKELSDVNENEFLELSSVHESYYARLSYAVMDFADKGWL